MTKRDEYHLTFLDSEYSQFKPDILDLDYVFPGRAIWIFALGEPYTLVTTQFDELAAKGWVPVDLGDPEGEHGTRPFLPLFSQLYFTLILNRRDDPPEKRTLWTRAQDWQHAKDYPVILTDECGYDVTMGQAARLRAGRSALIFGEQLLYRYFLHDLSGSLAKEASRCFKLIDRGMSPKEQTFTNVTASGILLPGEVLVRQYEEYERQVLQEVDDACDAAARLAELYWEHHQRNPRMAIRLVEQLSDIPERFRRPPQPGYLVPATLGLDAALSAIANAASGAKRWQEHEHGPAYTLSRPQGKAEIALSTPYELMATLPRPDVIHQMWQQVSRFNDLDGDILLILIAHAIAAGADERGGIWITVEQILEMRDIKQKQHTAADGSKRDAGYRAEDIEKIMASIDRLRNLHVVVREERVSRKKKARKRTVRQRSYLFIISDLLERDRESKRGAEKGSLRLAWYYRLGECLQRLPLKKSSQAAEIEGRAQAGWLLREALRYNPVSEQWEKRLARYFFFHLRSNDSFGNATIQRSIGSLMAEASLPTNDDNPERTKQHFERAMQRLVTDGHISDWSEEQYRKDMAHLPTRHWIDAWLSYSLWITAMPLTNTLIDQALEVVDWLKLRPQILG